MRSQVTHSSDVDMRDLATYFAAQTPTATSVATPAENAGKGQALFLAGDPARGIPPARDATAPMRQEAR
jgi:hypothetical protein